MPIVAVSESGIGGLNPGNNFFNRIWVIDESGQEIVEAVAGEKITVVCSVFAENLDYSWPNSWKLSITAIEMGQPITSAWKNAQDVNVMNKQFSHDFLKLNEYSGGSLTMPNINLNLRVRMWLRDSTSEPFPSESEW